MSFYASNSAAALAEDILLKCGQLFVKKYEYEGSGTVGTPGAACVITLATGSVSADDVFNGMTLHIRDDNGALCTVTIDDSATAADTITVDTTSANKVSDEATAGSFTASTAYNLYILGTEQFVGYSTQNLDYEEETVEFLDCNEKVRDDTTRVVLGFSGDAKNFSAEKTFAEIFSLTQYGSQTSQSQYHGGFSPPTRSYYQATLRTENVMADQVEITLFKGQFFANGAIDFSAAGEYKIVPYSFKAVKDVLRDSTAVNGWSIKEAA